MMTLIARLCALCAVCTMMQMAFGGEERGGAAMISGLLMLHLVISGLQEIASTMLEDGNLMHIFAALMK